MQNSVSTDSSQSPVVVAQITARSKPFGDRLILRGLRFDGLHGVNEDEKRKPQVFVIDVDAWFNMQKCAKTDDIEDTVSYTAIHRIVKEVVEGRHFDLLEALTETIADKIFNAFKQVTDVRVRIGKPKVAAIKNADYLGIEIFRTSPFKAV